MKTQICQKMTKIELLTFFVKTWQFLDITGYRMPEIEPSIMEPYHIRTFGIPKVSKVRYMNPELSAQVKKILSDWEAMGIVREYR